MNPEVDNDTKLEAAAVPQKHGVEAGVLPMNAENVGAGQAETGQSAPPPQAPPIGQTNDPAQDDNMAAMGYSNQGQAVQSQTMAFGMPAIADDTDLIEREWVDKAKEIVERTMGDPHEQNDQLTRMKADYLKKRYNKDIKLNGA